MFLNSFLQSCSSSVRKHSLLLERYLALKAITVALAASICLSRPTGVIAGELSPPAGVKVALCKTCHGLTGLPTDPTVPIIWGQQAAYLRKQLDDYRNGDRENQIMSSIAESLSEADIATIARFFSAAAWPSRMTPAAPAPAAIAACTVCHRANFTGGDSPAGIAPRLADQFSPYLIDTMAAFASGDRANNSQMSALMQGLSAPQRQAIANYLAALR